MSNWTEPFKSLDVIWRKESHIFSPKVCYIYVQGEFGFLPYICASGLAGKITPVCEIMSENMSVEPFNRLPNPVPPSWGITQIEKNVALLSINHHYPMAMMPDSNPDIWGKSYTLMRDTLQFLAQHGCQQIVFVTSMTITEAEQQADLYEYDIKNNIHPESPLMLALPAWAMPYMWDGMGKAATVLAVSQDEGQFIDMDAYKLLREYLIAVGLDYDDTHAERTMKMVQLVQQAYDQTTAHEGFGGSDLQ